MATYSTPAGPVAKNPVDFFSTLGPQSSKVTSDEQVRQARLAKVTEAAQASEDAGWNPFKKVGAAIKGIAASAKLNDRISSTERIEAAGDEMKPLIEDVLVQKYKKQQLQRDAEIAALPSAGPLTMGKGKTGEGQSVLTAQVPLAPGQKRKVQPMEMVKTPSVTTDVNGGYIAPEKRAKQEAVAYADEQVIMKLMDVVQKPSPLDRVDETVDALSRGMIFGLDSDFRSARVQEATNRKYPKGIVQKVAEPTLQLAGMAASFALMEGAAIKVGASMRTVEAIDKAYKVHPYLMRMVTAELASTSTDAAVRTSTGQDYQSKDFFLSLGMGLGVDFAIGTKSVRLLAQVDNEVSAMQRTLGRMPRSDELLEHMQDMRVAGEEFNWGSLFAERRLAFQSGIDPNTALPPKGRKGIEIPGAIPPPTTPPIPPGGVAGGMLPEGFPKDIPGIRISKTTDVGAKRSMSRAYSILEENPDLLNRRTRGIVSDAEAVQRAAEQGISKDALLSLRVGETMTKEQITATRRLVAAHGQDVEKLRLAAAEEAFQGTSSAVQKEYSVAVMEHAKLAAIQKGIGTEAGRSLQSFRMEIEPFTRVERRFMELLNSADKDTAEQIAKRLGKIPNQGDYEKAVLDEMKKLTKPSYMNMVVEFATAAKLWRPTTHVVNATSNATYNLGIAAFRLPVSVVDKIRSLATGTKQERFAVEAWADFAGQYGKGLKKAFYVPFSGSKQAVEGEGALLNMRQSMGEVWKALADESYVVDGTIEDAIGRIPAIRGTSKNAYVNTAVDAAGKAIRLPYRLLNAGDVAFRTMANAGEQGALVARQVASEGLTGKKATERFIELLANPTDEIMELSTRAAKSRVFQDDLTGIARHVNAIRNIPIIGPAIRLTMLPFLKTPANLIKKGFRSVNPVDLVRGIKAGGGEASESVTRSLLGYSTTGFLFWYASQGLLTGSPPKDRSLREELYASGWQPYSVRIGDRYVSYDRMEPFSQSFRNSAAIWDAYRVTGQINQDFVQEAAKNIAVGTLDRSYIKGMYETLNAMFDPDRYGENYMNNFIVGSTPLSGLGAGIVSAIDTDAEGRQIIRDPKNLTEYMKARIPGMSEQVAPRLDTKGRAMVRRGSPIERLLSPMVTSEADLPAAKVEEIYKRTAQIQGINAEVRDESAQLREKALQVINELRELPMNARVQNMVLLQQKNPDVYKAVETLLKKKAKGIDYIDERVLSLPVKGRAKFMLEILKELPKDQRAAKYLDWKNKGVMTTETEKALRKLLVPSPISE